MESWMIPFFSALAEAEVWIPEKTKELLTILEEYLPKVIEVSRNFPNTTGAQTLLMRVMDALLFIEEPANEEFKRNAHAVRERCTNVQRERLDFLLESVDAWLPFLHSSEANTQLYRDCQFLLLLLRAVHLRRILQIGGSSQSLKEKLET
ncbi:unnamed protein product, partial [Symbiodinium necroappetens]